MKKCYFALSVLTLFFIVALSSCEKEINEENLKNRKWILTDLEVLSENKEPIKEVYIEFQDSFITGHDGCNSYWIENYKLEENLFEVESIAGTLIYCGEEITDFEELYLKVLKSSKRIQLEGNRLTINSEIGKLHYKE